MTEPSVASQPARIMHTMIRVGELERFLRFHTRFGMRLLRRHDFADGRYAAEV